MSNNVIVTVQFNGRTINLLATPKVYAPNEKSGGQDRHGFFTNGTCVLDVQSDTDKMLVTIDGHDSLVLGKLSSNDNWNFNVSKAQTINGVEYQVGLNITAKKSPGVRPTGLHEFVIGCNITPRLKAAQKATQDAPKTKNRAKTAAKEQTQPTVETAPAPKNSLKDILARLRAGN